MKINYKRLAIFIFVPLLLGGLVGLITTNNEIESIIPAWIFPVVWSILYILMGVSTYRIYEKTRSIPIIYVGQLIFNLLWSFIFFKFKLFTLAFIWIIALIIMVIIMIKTFLSKDKLAGYLQIPYLIWLFIALYLSSTFIF